jgi:hypothetical protein
MQLEFDYALTFPAIQAVGRELAKLLEVIAAIRIVASTAVAEPNPPCPAIASQAPRGEIPKTASRPLRGASSALRWWILRPPWAPVNSTIAPHCSQSLGSSVNTSSRVLAGSVSWMHRYVARMDRGG